MNDPEPDDEARPSPVGATPEPSGPEPHVERRTASDERAPIVRWLAALGALALYGLATFLPVPGVDHETLAAVAGAGGLLGLFGIATPLVSPFGSMAIWLVITRGVARVIAKEPDAHVPWASRVMFAFFVIIAVVRGLGLAMYLEGVSSMGDEVVAEPGYRFRGIVALTFAGAAAITWAIASFVSRTRVAQGPLLLFGAGLITEHVLGGLEVGRAIATGVQAPLGALVHLASLLPGLVVLLALWRRTPAVWPLRVARGVALTSPADLLFFPYLSGLALTSVLATGPGLLLPGAWIVPYLGLGLSVALAVGVLVWMRRLPSDRPRRGYLVTAVVAPVSSLVLVACGVATAVASGAQLAGAFGPPGPFAGDEDLRVEVVSSVGAAAGDAPVVRARLRELGVDADVRAVGRDRLVIDLSDVRDAREALAIALRPSVLSFRLVAIDQGALAPRDGVAPPDGVEIDVRSFGDEPVRVFAATSRAALAPVLARPGVVPAEVAVECEDGERPRCTPWRLEPVVLTSRDVAEADVEFDEQLGAPSVSVTFTDAAAERFEDLTAASIRRRLAICIDDEIVSAPVIQSRIPGGRARIAMGRADGALALHRQAAGLVAALRAGSIEGTWRIDSVGPRTR